MSDAARWNLDVLGGIDLPKFPLFETNFTVPLFESISEQIQGLLPTNWPKDLHFNQPSYFRLVVVQLVTVVNAVWAAIS